MGTTKCSNSTLSGGQHSLTLHATMADMLSTYTLQQAVAERWPGRHAEVAKLFALLGPCAHHVPDLFVYGLPSTGKTSVVRWRARDGSLGCACTGWGEAMQQLAAVCMRD